MESNQDQVPKEEEKPEVKILILGLKNSGKTSLLFKLRLGEVKTSTENFPTEIVQYKHLKFIAWDLEGEESIRKSWKDFYPGTKGLIFVVDSSDSDKIDIAKEELYKLLGEEELKGSFLLVFNNKQDKEDSMRTTELVERFEMRGVRDRIWYCQACDTVSGDGLYEGLDWISKQIKGKEKKEDDNDE